MAGHIINQRRMISLIAAIGLTLAACGSDGPDAGESSSDQSGVTDVTAASDTDDADHDEEFNFGEPADAADADRVVEIVADDKFTFDPDNIAITSGETVTFRVQNVGNLPHDFTLGDADLQEEHDKEMAAMAPADMGAHPEPNAVVVQPGETKELTWHFSESTEILFGCHIPGHYAAGMKGDITVEA